jgi:hypothetical protein
MLLQLTVAGTSAFLLEPWVWQALLSFHRRAKNAPSQKANLGSVCHQQVVYTIFGEFFYYRKL